MSNILQVSVVSQQEGGGDGGIKFLCRKYAKKYKIIANYEKI